jgi:molybdopterin-containing oxidoreductase family membrane subunit
VSNSSKNNLSFARVNTLILDLLEIPPRRYFMMLGTLFLIFAIGFVIWVFQTEMGLGVAGINHPVGWATYITNFIFWVGIAHSGTLISAVLFLAHSKWRDAVSRSTEAMTVFAVMTAGLFPLIHLGRVWVFYYILPYPNQRDLFPNFMSPLVWDVVAVLTYFTVSLIFFYFGMIPDLAAARDKFLKKYGKTFWRTKVFKALSGGWVGSLSQWRHYNRSYLLFAALATPLVVSVHSIVSWDFAMSLLPGWHSTLFAPYFVAGAIHSGLAMAFILMIPMRHILNLKQIITDWHLETIAKTILVTTLIIAYTYIIEPAIEFYAGETIPIQFTQWRVNGEMNWIYFMLIILNVLVPLTFLFRKMRRNIKWLFITGILINIGMWFERYFIVVGSTAHDFLPHNWSSYSPTWVEMGITLGMFGFFFFLFIGFSRFFPTIPLAEYKESLHVGEVPDRDECTGGGRLQPKFGKGMLNKMYVFSSQATLTDAVKKLCENNIRNMETFSPHKVNEVEKVLGTGKSPVSLWTLAGGLFGLVAGFSLTMGTASVYDLIVGGKMPDSIIPYTLIMFELMIFFGALTNFISVMYYSKLYKSKVHSWYDPRFGVDKYGLLISYEEKDKAKIQELIKPFEPEEEHDQK